MDAQHYAEALVSDACQINDFDHRGFLVEAVLSVSDACQINDFDHRDRMEQAGIHVSDACQINDFDHNGSAPNDASDGFRCLSDQ